MAMVTNHAEKIRNMHLVVVIQGERSGNTTAQNRSTATKRRLWMDTSTDREVKSLFNLHIKLTQLLLDSLEFWCNARTCHGIRINGINKSQIAMLTIRKLIVFFKACVLKTTIIRQELPKIESDEDQTVSHCYTDLECCGKLSSRAERSVCCCIHTHWLFSTS